MLIEQPPAQVADNLWLLGSYEYPLYLVRDEREAAIFEAGTGPMGPIVGAQLAGLGVALDAIQQVIVLHAHPDHVMALPWFRQNLPHATVVASQSAANTLANEKAVAFFCQIDDAIADALEKQAETGTGPFCRNGPEGAAHKRGLSPFPRRVPMAENRIAVDQILKEGDTLAVAGLTFQVLETFGHSDCSLCFFEPQRRILFSSDAAGYYMRDHDYWWPNYFAGYQPYVASIERLAGLRAEILCQGHHGAIVGAEEVEAFLRTAIRATQEYHERIVAQIGGGKAVRPLAEQLGAEVHAKSGLLPLDFFQKNCGLLIKQSMKHAGISPP